MAAEAAASKVPSSERMRRRAKRDDACARQGMAAPAP
jgi:hypothetical protein